MDELIIPGTNKILLDGTILILSGFDDVKYIIHHGFYRYNGEMFEGWYGVSIPEQQIIPISQQMLIGCEVCYYPNSNCQCRFPSGNIPFTTDDKYQLQRSFITVDTMSDRDALSPRMSVADLPNGRIIRVNKPNNIDINPKYYVYTYNVDLTSAYWEEISLYVIPSTGIPKSDLSEDVQLSLDRADSALQELPIASDTTLGGIIVGDNLAIDESGVLSAESALPTYYLNWYDNPTQAQIDANLRTLNEIRNLEAGSYLLYLVIGTHYVSLGEVSQTEDSIRIYFEAIYQTDIIYTYIISSADAQNYNQSILISPDSIFDAQSDAVGSMRATATYIDTRIGTTGNLDPSSYASASDVADIESLIPNQATPENQLADKDFVNSSIATNTAYFIGTFESIQSLTLYSDTLTNNDYAFVILYNSVDPTQIDAYDRYKYNAQEYGYIALDESEAPTWEADTYYNYNHTNNEYVLTLVQPDDWTTNYNDYFIEKSTPGCWLFEYELNNSSFTASQWAAINSAITADLVTAYSSHIANTTIHVTESDKTIWNGKYTKPTNGIPKSDLANGVQTSLGLADTALQSIPTASAQTLGGVKVGTNLSIDDGVLSADSQVSSQERQNWNGAVTSSGTLTLPATSGSWIDNLDGTYSQTVTISSGTANTKVDLQVNLSVIEQMQSDKISALYVINNNAVFSVIAVGNAPTDTITVQYTRYEVVTSS